MEKNAYQNLNQQLPPPVGPHLPVDQLNGLPVDPTVQLKSDVNPVNNVELVGPDGYRFSVSQYSNQSCDERNVSAKEAGFDIEANLFEDVGAIDFAPVGEIVDYAKISYHGLRFSMAKVRENRAIDRIKRMNHKDKLYSELAAELATLATATEKPQTNVERLMDRRLEKKAWKHEIKKAKQKYIMSVNSVNGVESRASSTTGIRAKLNTYNRITQVKKDYKSGNITASGQRTAIINIKAKPTEFENESQGKSRKKVESTTKSLERAVRQPISKRWRSFRRLNAEDRIYKQQKQAQAHLQKAIDIKNR